MSGLGHLALLRDLHALEPRVWIFGGVAEDALLYGRFSREHSDVDLFVLREDLDARIEQARALGFDDFHLRMDSWPETPLVVGAFREDVLLELIVFDRAPDGRVYVDLPVPDGMKRFWLPTGALEHPASAIEGVPVRTFSPLALHQLRSAVAETFGGFRPKDAVAQSALERRFFPGASEEELAPTTERVEAPLAPLTYARSP